MELREQHHNLSQTRAPADHVYECGSRVSKHACEDPMDTHTQRTDDSASQRPSKKRCFRTKVNVVNIHTRLQLMKHERWQKSLALKQEREMKRALVNNSFSKKGSSKKGSSKKGGAALRDLTSSSVRLACYPCGLTVFLPAPVQTEEQSCLH